MPLTLQIPSPEFPWFGRSTTEVAGVAYVAGRGNRPTPIPLSEKAAFAHAKYLVARETPGR